MSLKSMAAEGKIKKTDLFRCRWDDLKVEPGFNLRDLSADDTQEHINSIYTTIVNGGDVPPLDVRVDSDDNIWIVDGHCRHAAYGLAIANGVPIEFINVLPYRGNDAERVAKMITSSQGKILNPLEAAFGYKRLVKFGWEHNKIASSVGKTEEHVKQLMILANANTDVHQQVASGAIGAYAAIDVVRKYGEKSGEFIAKQLTAAESNGKSRVTKTSMEGRSLPKKVVSGLVMTMQTFAQRLDSDTRRTLASLETATEEELKGKTVQVDAAALLELMRAQAAIDEVKVKQDEKDLAKAEASKQTKMEL